MPSYSKHILFSIIITLPFIQDVFYLSLAVIGALLIDMDHHVKKNNIIIMVISGLIISFVLYILNLPFLSGFSLVTLALILYISKHRGFSHSIFGVILLSILLGFFVIGLYSLSNSYIFNKFSLILISLILGIIVLNKKIVLPFFIIISSAIIIGHGTILSPYFVFLAVLIGGISHIMIDMFTPSGIKLLSPFSFKKFNKFYGYTLLIFWIFTALIFNFKIMI